MLGRTGSRVLFALALIGCFTGTAAGVSLSADGVGQALIYPYYTAQSAEGNAFNTYVSVVNHAADAKALRVRFREGRLGKEVLAFNLFLGANDVWTGAVVPTPGGARLFSSDISCTDPPFVGGTHLEFRTEALADEAGPGIERTREGFVEMIEMGTLPQPWADAVGHGSNAQPRNCSLVRGVAIDAGAPTGGIAGTLTLINVSSGLDFTMNADALAGLASRAFYRPATDAYPDFTAAEIVPVSFVVDGGQAYRSVWTRPQDAVSAVLMRNAWLAEYVLDAVTTSLTDVVLTMPTRHLYPAAAGPDTPFEFPQAWSPTCNSPGASPLGERLAVTWYDRRTRFGPSCTAEPCSPLPPLPTVCASASVTSVRNGFTHMPPNPVASGVFGSLTRGAAAGGVTVTSSLPNGWLRFQTTSSSGLSSLETSTRIDLATGQRFEGAHRFRGLPVTGFWARTFRNGTLQCGAGSCQGNYGGAFPLRYQRSITPVS